MAHRPKPTNVLTNDKPVTPDVGSPTALPPAARPVATFAPGMARRGENAMPMDCNEEAISAVVPFQPVPRITRVGYLDVVVTVATTITRHWNVGDSARCQLCPQGECTVCEDVCTITVPKFVPEQDARLFPTHGLTTSVPPGARLNDHARRVIDGSCSGDGRARGPEVCGLKR